MKQFLSTLIIALVALCSSESAKAWTNYAHGTAAYIAEQHLSPKAKEKCHYYLKHTLPYYAS
ncbi:MAG: S1/P1 Nuclease, partial [Alistipes sp.]|nr:S1/P1 Nuclease [Alistipes sp.]